MKRKPLTIITIFTVLLIWAQSLLPAAASSFESVTAMKIILPAWNSLYFLKWILLDENLVRKLFGHFLEYTILGAELGGLSFSLHKKYSILPCLFLGLCVACIDEALQFIGINRNPSLLDIGIDFLGILFGMAVTGIIIWALKLPGKRNTSAH